MSADGDATMLLRQEQAVARNEWTAVSRVRVSKRVVTEVQTLEVEVRREELVVTTEPLEDDESVVFAPGTAPRLPEPLTFVLRAEVPAVTLNVMPVERVTLTTTVVDGEQTVTLPLAAERLILST